MAVAPGLLTLYYTFAGPPSGSVTTSLAIERNHLDFAAIIASIYVVTQLAAAQYPNTLCIHPEFGSGCPQYWICAASLSITAIGYGLKRRRISARQVAKVD